MSNEEIANVANELRKYAGVVRDLLKDKSSPQLMDFIAAVETYAKYIDGAIELSAFADKVLQPLADAKGYNKEPKTQNI